ncbi:MAG: tRNA (adenosine(37)-N6)-threonylcarbamoyltransferase complex ATPase subunit type 1 TsaE [Synergistaceae bacterium]|jgi:tRNA threonylcarbamoyladenosine biosynthesis protein TsaE|nr:tRNA (adenosine(37)-N6)-threonylcarbamoyltransferase complex ATPase subunit type 1 TsaE [Synergistaceae bacterium]
MAESAVKDDLTCGFPDISVDAEDETEIIGGILAAEIYGGLAVVLTGPLGSGKTALVRAVAGALGIKSVKSPTFTTETVHRTSALGFDLVHADLYRLDSRQIGLDTELQFEEYLSERRAVLFVEWGERWNAPRTDCWRVDIYLHGQPNPDARRFGFRAFGEEAARRLASAYGRMIDAFAESRRRC